LGSTTVGTVVNLFETPSAQAAGTDKEFTNEVKNSYNNIVLGGGIEKEEVIQESKVSMVVC
jgi:uncharacterized protein related to proFAR isomerase